MKRFDRLENNYEKNAIITGKISNEKKQSPAEYYDTPLPTPVSASDLNQTTQGGGKTFVLAYYDSRLCADEPSTDETTVTKCKM